MSWLIRTALGAYRQALRCYPRPFREMFAEEMIDTFVSRMTDAEGAAARLSRIAGEAAALPLSVIREHHHARRLAARAVHGGQVMNGGHIMMMTKAPRPFRRMSVLWAAIAAIYVGMVVAPFFLFGIRTYPAEDVIAGQLDPKSACVPAAGRMPHPQCVSLYGSSPILPVTYLVMYGAPALGIGMAAVTGWRLARRWKRLPGAQRAAGTVLSLAWLSLAAFAMSPLGSLIYRWLMD